MEHYLVKWILSAGYNVAKIITQDGKVTWLLVVEFEPAEQNQAVASNFTYFKGIDCTEITEKTSITSGKAHFIEMFYKFLDGQDKTNFIKLKISPTVQYMFWSA